MRRRMMMSSEVLLPPYLEQMAYIETHDGAYINTHYKATGNTQMMFRGWQAQEGVSSIICGYRVAYQDNAQYLHPYSTGSRSTVIAYNNKIEEIVVDYTKSNYYRIDRFSRMANQQIPSAVLRPNTTTFDIIVLGYNNNGTPYGAIDGSASQYLYLGEADHIVSLGLLYKENLSARMIPCRTKQPTTDWIGRTIPAGEYCMWDFIRKGLFANEGTGYLTGGKHVPQERV